MKEKEHVHRLISRVKQTVMLLERVNTLALWDPQYLWKWRLPLHS
jgi:hypothetical protein